MRVPRWIGLLLFSLTAALAAGQQSSAAGAASASIVGVVTDPQDALIPGAIIQVVGDTVKDRSAKTNDVGAFAVNDLPAGATLRVTIKATGFGDWNSAAIVLTPGQMLELPNINLVVAAEITSVSAATAEKVAIEQVQLAERQRLFGILPNFYVAYDTRFIPLSPKLKFQLALRTSVDPATFLGAAFLAGIDQASDVAPHYEQGASGYGKRVGAAYAGSAIDIVLGGAVFPTLFRQDPRYFYKGTGTKKSRMLHAMSSPFVARGDNGHSQINISSLMGDFSASAATNLYYPTVDRGVGLVFKGALEATGARMVSSVLQEFVFRKLTTNAHHRSHSSKAGIVSAQGG
jgi:hypothetical protein